MRRSEEVTAITCFVLIAILILTAKHSNAMTFDGLEQLDEVRQTIVEESHWQSIGEQRITTYCRGCDTCDIGYAGYQLYEGCAACNFLPMGTKVRVDGNEYVIADLCGIDNTIDIYIDSDICHCDTLKFSEVEVWKEE